MRNIFKPVPLDVQILNQAIDSDFDDLEDAIQFHSAIRAEADCLITRDTGIFPAADLTVLAPAEFLASAGAE
jgi:predicted nucleic acid-binding protein